jgi:MFS family permease
MELQRKANLSQVFSLPVIVAALGYFVDIYDLVLFSIVRVPSLKALGLSGQELIDQGVYLLNMQMAGMLVGGILWGILGDRLHLPLFRGQSGQWFCQLALCLRGLALCRRHRPGR